MPAAPALRPRPPVKPPARRRFPAAEHHRLDNGMSVYLQHLPGQHVATVICHLGIPADAEPEGCDGVAAVMAACLGTGTRDIAAREFEQQAAAAGITWKTGPGWTGPAITLELPATKLAAALNLLRLALDEPAFSPVEVRTQIQLAAARLVRATATPEFRVRRELPAAIYGAAGRAGRPADGTLATVSRLTPDSIASFYQDQVRPDTTTIVIAGDLSGFDAALASQAFASWQDLRPASIRCPGCGASPGQVPLREPALREPALREPALREPALREPARRPAARRPAAAVLVNQPGAVQAQLLLAVPAPSRGQPGWDELLIAADILGAPITGHLETRLRENSGHSYSLRVSPAELMPGAGLLLVTGAVATEAAAGALSDILGILTTPLRDGFDPAGCAAAAEAVTRTMPLAYLSPPKVAAITADLAAARLPPDFPDLVLDDVAVLTPDDITRAYREHFRADQMTLIVVGDVSTLAGPLGELTDPIPLQVIST
jgi:predicted Zn-dependent peptidase